MSVNRLSKGSLPVTTKTSLTPAAPSSYTVGATSGQAVASNSNRKGVTIINMGTVNVSLGFSNAAVADSGITLTPNGSYVMDEYTYTTGAINAICSSSSSLAIQEYN